MFTLTFRVTFRVRFMFRFYERTFDMEQARRKVASILAGVEMRKKSVALLMKRKCVIKGTQYA